MPKKRRVYVRKRGVNKQQNLSYLPYVGSLKAPVYLILDPVVQANPNGVKNPLSRDQMEWFVDHLRNSGGFAQEDVCIISCAPAVDFDTWGLGAKINAHLKDHREELLALIKANEPKLIMPFGAKACQQLVGRAVQITKVRGQPIQEENICNDIPLLPLFSPFFARRQPENEATFRSDLQTAGRIHRAGYDLDASAITYEHEYKWCYNLDFLVKKAKAGKLPRLSVDVEGVGLIAFSPKTRLLTVQFCWEEGKSVCVPINYDRGDLRHHGFIPWKDIDRKRLIKQVRYLLEHPGIEKVGQNLKFDWAHLHYQLGIDMENYKHDTMLQAHLLDENQRRINLDDLVRQNVPEMAGFNDTLNLDPEHHGKSRMDLLTPDKFVIYGCGDTDAAWRLCDVLEARLMEDPALHGCYENVTMPAQRAFCEIEVNGFPVSVRQLRSFEKKLRLHQKLERAYLLRQIPKAIKDKWRDSGVGVKVTRKAILVDWLYEHEDGMGLTPRIFTKTGQPSTSSKLAMPYFVADHPVISRVMAYIKNDKMLNTYTKGFYKYIYEGKIRPTYKLAATVTGRSASADPNGQNFPKRGKMAKEYRKVFQAPKGWCFVALDLSQAELRIAAMMSGDTNMLQVYADGGDIHRATAAGTMGITLEEFLALPKDVQDLKRFQAKAVNFGFLYGMWWVKFREYAKTDYGIDFTEDEAKEIRENFFRTYPMLEVWHNEVQQLVQDQGMIRTFDGRIRHLPNVYSNDESVAKMALRQGINSPVQSIASDLGLMSLGRLMPYLKKKGYNEWLKPCGFIHDAIVCLVREDKVGQAINIVKRFMENNPLEKWFDWVPEIPIIADAEIGRTLSVTYELSPNRYQGDCKNKSYADFLSEEISTMRSRITKKVGKPLSSDAKKANAKLKAEIATAEADLAQCVTKPSHTKTSRRIIIRTKAKTNAKTKSYKRPEKSRRIIRKSKSGGERSYQLNG